MCEKVLLVSTFGGIKFTFLRCQKFSYCSMAPRKYPVAPLGAMASRLGTSGVKGSDVRTSDMLLFPIWRGQNQRSRAIRTLVSPWTLDFSDIKGWEALSQSPSEKKNSIHRCKIVQRELFSPVPQEPRARNVRSNITKPKWNDKRSAQRYKNQGRGAFSPRSQTRQTNVDLIARTRRKNRSTHRQNPNKETYWPKPPTQEQTNVQPKITRPIKTT